MDLLQLHRLSRTFGKVKAVDEVSFTLQSGQFVTLLGPSGCGKTTTLRLIAGFEIPDSGTLSFREKILAGPGVFVAAKDRQIGMVFQDYALFPHLDVAQNIAFGLAGDKGKKTRRVGEMLDLVGLNGYEKRMPHELSGGQQQRVALARALAPEPEMLLLDEPFSNLDAALRTQVRAEMSAILRQANTTCIFVTHAQEEALSLSDTIAVMFGGKLLQIDSPRMLYEKPATSEIATFVGEANFIEGEAKGDCANSMLGPIPLINPTYGQVKLLIRPEMLQLLPPSSEARPAQIVWREYYGHDQRVKLALPDNTTLIARFSSMQTIELGETVGVRVQGQAMAYEL